MWKPYVFFIGLAEFIGLLSGLVTKNNLNIYQTLKKPPLSPPGALFPIVWSILYALMGIGAARVWLEAPSPERSRSLRIFITQLIANFLWSLIFFNLQAYGFAFLWLVFLWILILLMISSFYQVNKEAALLQIPYLLWVTFAGYLNFMIWYLNR